MNIIETLKNFSQIDPFVLNRAIKLIELTPNINWINVHQINYDTISLDYIRSDENNSKRIVTISSGTLNLSAYI